MIEINPSKYKFLKILWKGSKSSPVQVIQLLTVTYDTACAPYLATKEALQQLTFNEQKPFPLASTWMSVFLDHLNLEEFKFTQSDLRGGMSLPQVVYQ